MYFWVSFNFICHYFVTVHLPKQIEPVNFWAKYTPPPPPEPGQKRLPEDIEAELKQQEQELNELALVNIVYVLNSCI